MKRLTFLVFFIVITLAFNALALEVPPKPLGRVSDFTGTLKGSELFELQQTLAKFEWETTNQIAVVLMPSLEGDNLEDYSIRLADKWKIGQEGKDNGVILLIVKQDRKIRIEVGYGLEGVLPDSLAGDIIRSTLAPHFRRGDFYGGIREGIQRIILATGREYQYQAPVQHAPVHQAPASQAPKPKAYASPVADIAMYSVVILFGFVLLMMVLRMLSEYKDWKSEKSRAKTKQGFWSYRKIDLIAWGPSSYSGGFGGGGGGYYGGGFSGGFSGGGGGFGGGGASGGW